jgi:hypothetical protein
MEIHLKRFVIFSKQYQKKNYPFGAEMEVAQIVVTPKVSDAESKSN